jgi:hypothetical protein
MKPNIYYSPENFNLDLVAEIDYLNRKNYPFDVRAVWRHKETKKLYTARHDNYDLFLSPFEDHTTLDDLSPFVYEEIHREVTTEATKRNNNLKIFDFLGKLRTAMREE